MESIKIEIETLEMLHLMAGLNALISKQMSHDANIKILREQHGLLQKLHEYSIDFRMLWESGKGGRCYDAQQKWVDDIQERIAKAVKEA